MVITSVKFSSLYNSFVYDFQKLFIIKNVKYFELRFNL